MTSIHSIGIWCSIIAVGLFASCKQSKTEEAKAQENKIPIDSKLAHRIDSCSQRLHPTRRTAVFVYDLTAEKPVFGMNQNDTMPTASCMKLLTGIAAEHLLGEDYRFDTKLYAKGRIVNNVLKGQISFKGSLDPQFTAPDFRLFVQRLKKRGVKKIEGKIWVDLAIDQPVTSEEHWYPWDLSFSKYGIFYKGKERVMREFKAYLRAQGISFVDSCVNFGRTPKGSVCLFCYRRPISLVLERMWKNSSNTQSTGLLYAIGYKADPSKNPTESGVAYLRQFLRSEVATKDSTYVVHDGCGLCTHNRLSPVHLVDILRYGYQNPGIFKSLNKHLPLSGVDGTLHREMTHGPAFKKIRAKTGTLSHPYGISTLAGYCTGKNGHQLCFAIMNCEMSVLDARVIQRKLCEQFVK